MTTRDADNTDGPECDLCSKTDCPDADLPEFSVPAACAYAPFYEALRYDRCEYGCGRDITKTTIRRDLLPLIERIQAEARRTALTETADAWQQGQWTIMTGQHMNDIGKAQTVTDWLRARAGLG